MPENFADAPPFLLPLLVAAAVLASGVALAWPWLVPNDTTRRLREHERVALEDDRLPGRYRRI